MNRRLKRLLIALVAMSALLPLCYVFRAALLTGVA
jgi:hypothetical protein